MSNITQNGGIIYIQQSGNNIQYQSNSTSGSWTNVSSWPVTFLNSNPVAGNILTVLISTDILISDSIVGTGTNGYFITGSNYITYDGTGKTITISSVTNYPGLIQNGYSNVTVQNINNAISGSSSLQNSGGWICHANFGSGVNNVLIDNCSNSAPISDSGGGICGERVGGNGGTISITNCSNSGIMNLNNGGGICGRQIAINNGTVLISNCSNSGVINGVAIGGICGNGAGQNNGIITIANCYNTGAINGSENGGMTGRNTCFNNGTITITNCYNTGIIGSGSGGMCGAFFAWNTNNLCTIKNCYNIGDITGNIAGGFIGYDIGYSTNLSYTSNILIENCYSLGNIGTNAGGICGGGVNSYTTNPVVNITNCYTSYNSIAQAGSEYISLIFRTTIRDSIINRLTNVYTSLISSWNDNSANSSLIGSAWTSVATNSPYILSIFNASLYSPSTITNISTGDYTSSAGLFTPNYNYNLISVNNVVPPSNITINNTSGVLTFTNLLTNTYVEKVLCYQGTSPKYYEYNFNTFTLNQTSPGITIIQNGGIIYIQQSGNDIQYQSNSTTGIWTTVNDWPVKFVNSNPLAENVLIISLFTNITISDTTIGISTKYFIIDSEYITYDGTGKIVTIENINNYPGLIQNGTSSDHGYSNVTVQNINNAISGSSRLVSRGGWICQWYFGNGASNILINNCSNSAAINGIDIAYGGICGAFAGRYGGNVSIKNCSNSGAIIRKQSSGICGQQAGDTNGTVSISNCFNSGVISGEASGGICGTRAGHTNGIILITNCYNTGIINGDLSGGITADYFGYNTTSQCSIINCYNTGDINGSNAGGITGAEVGYYDNVAYSPQILIQNCYSLGNIANTCGGICGGEENDIYDNPPIVNIINCYTSYNTISDPGSEYVSIYLQTNVKYSIINSLTNVYTSFINNWLDTNAISALYGSQNIYRNSKLYKYYSNFGDSWYYNQNNTPFFLTSYLKNVPRRKPRN
jgi:hypothetical protein